MNSEFAVIAAVGCAVCNAFAAILQKISSDKVAKIDSFNLSSLRRLFQQLPYVAGVLLDVAAGILTLVAVHKLPLFLVQAIIASSVVLTAILERIILKRKLSWHIYLASLVVVAGLGLLALSSHAERIASTTDLVRYTIILLPVLIVAVGFVAMKMKNKLSAFLLAALSGAAFGGVSVIGRLLVYPDPIWLVLKNPLLWSMAAYGLFGLYFFTVALQRSIATTTNGIMLSAQTVVPLLVGVLVLGDTARNGLWVLVWAGCVLVTGGCVYIAFTDQLRS